MLGREICEAYFQENVLKPPPRFDEILIAIEQHDIKEGKTSVGFPPDRSPGILDIVTVADDLEALGIIGIYRYIEIYLKRKTDLNDLGMRILRNASARYRNIEESCSNYPPLISEYRPQYAELVSFFDNYNQQLMVEQQARKVFHGHLGVANYIRTLSVEGETGPEDYLKKTGTSNAGTIVTEYFSALNNELSKAHLIDPAD
jgi:hypothetical protein